MTVSRLAVRSLVYYARTGAVVLFGLVIATAVVTGSLVIGDSVTGSLRDTALARLGAIDHALIAPRFFRAELASDLTSSPALTDATAAALILADGAAANPQSEEYIPNVAVYGVDAGFWSLHEHGLSELPEGRGCAINQSLAADLGVKQGEPVLLTVHRKGSVSLDTLFARRQREESAVTLRLSVASVLPDAGVGSLRLDAQSATPRNVFLERAWLATQLGREGQANVIVARTPDPLSSRSTTDLIAGLARVVELPDLGLSVEGAGRATVSVQSDGTLLSPAQIAGVTKAAGQLGASVQQVSVYLSTAIRREGGGKELAYSVVAGISEGFGGEAAPGPGAIWLNDWAARDLGAGVGDRLAVSYLVPTREGDYPERNMSFTLTRIVPTRLPYADPDLVPELEGISDADDIDDWDPPFPVDMSRITPRDDEYWDLHRAAPKAFITLDAAKTMWQGGPEGKDADWVTGARVSPPSHPSTNHSDAFKSLLTYSIAPHDAGLIFRPIRRQVIAAARGTSDFRSLFLGLSFFLVLSGAGLAGMLLRLSVERRSAQAGIMLACGLRPGQVRGALLLEGAALTLCGVALGVPAGVLYAGVLVGALATRWSGALGETAALWLHVEPSSLGIGGASGLAVGLVAVLWSIRHVVARPTLDLLRGPVSVSEALAPGGARRPLVLTVVFAVLAVGLVGAAAAEAVPAEGAFFGIGAALLAAAISGASAILAQAFRRPGSRSLGALAARNAAAGRSRSLLVIGLIASAAFVIVAVAANARDFSRIDVHRKDGGAGGFSLLATCSIPLPFDLSSERGRANLGFTPEDESALSGVQIMPFLVSPGEDISCLNIARPTHPRLLGVPEKMIRRGGFSVRQAAQDGAAREPWGLLVDPGPGAPIPAFGDADSIRWTLHSGPGREYQMPGPGLEPITLRFDGLISGSIFQREVLIPEAALRRLYPAITAPSYFLIAAPEDRTEHVATVLRQNLGQMGLQVRTTREVLNEFLQVQNTYLSMFLALGGLGLLLGTVGVAAVLLRNALERRSELALMLATGFRRRALAGLLTVENGGLIVAGICAGTVSALVAVAPRLVSVDAEVRWGAVLGLLVGIMLVGALTCALAARAAVQGSLVESLRHE